MSAIYPSRNPATAWRRLDDEVIIMSARDSSLFTLNEVAAEIWEAADGRTSLEEIVSGRICAKFEVGFDEALHDAEQFVRALAGHGVLLLAETPVGDEEPR